eukprot:6204486-Pleurochrysis_carterae.AAC.3
MCISSRQVDLKTLVKGHDLARCVASVQTAQLLDSSRPRILGGRDKRGEFLGDIVGDISGPTPRTCGPSLAKIGLLVTACELLNHDAIDIWPARCTHASLLSYALRIYKRCGKYTAPCPASFVPIMHMLCPSLPQAQQVSSLCRRAAAVLIDCMPVVAG